MRKSSKHDVVTDESSEDEPKSLSRKKVVDARRAQLEAPHVAQLTAFVRKLQLKTHQKVPYFDPLDGGTSAEVLFLGETPGRRARQSNFVSRNNPDETANNFFQFNERVGLLRNRTISWNIVLWYIGNKKKIQATSAKDCKMGIQPLLDLLELLPRLRAVVFFGKSAQRAIISVANLTTRRYQLFEAPHPSPQSVNRNKRNRHEIIRVLADVKSYLIRVNHDMAGSKFLNATVGY